MPLGLPRRNGNEYSQNDNASFRSGFDSNVTPNENERNPTKPTEYNGIFGGNQHREHRDPPSVITAWYPNVGESRNQNATFKSSTLAATSVKQGIVIDQVAIDEKQREDFKLSRPSDRDSSCDECCVTCRCYPNPSRTQGRDAQDVNGSDQLVEARRKPPRNSCCCCCPGGESCNKIVVGIVSVFLITAAVAVVLGIVISTTLIKHKNNTTVHPVGTSVTFTTKEETTSLSSSSTRPLSDLYTSGSTAVTQITDSISNNTYSTDLGIYSVSSTAALTTTPNCRVDEMVCGGNCVSEDWACDGVRDCPRGEDEDPLKCGNCTLNEYRCASKQQCINVSERCDGEKQCRDGSDENNCFTFAEGVEETFENNTAELISIEYRGQKGFLLCADNWSDDWGNQICIAMGYLELLYSVQAIPENTDEAETLWLKVNVSESEQPLLKQLQPSSNCSSEESVELACRSRITECGTKSSNISRVGPYIIRGNNAMPGAWPWNGALLLNGTFHCGLTLIDSKWAITAAHCVTDGLNPLSESSLRILFGSVKLSTPTADTSISIVVEAINVHPEFNRDNFTNDVALLRLNGSITMTDYIRPICLPSADVDIRRYKLCVDVGFGLTSPTNRNYSDSLQQARMAVISYDTCVKALQDVTFGKPNPTVQVDNETMLCIGSTSTPQSNSVNICLGDSGGSFACQDTQDHWTLVGVNSFFYGDCQISITSRLSSFLTWINSAMSV